MSIAYLPVDENFRTEAQNTIRFDFMRQKFSTKENSIIVDRYVKMFDKHFLHFITQRQQRDLAILQYAMQYLLQKAECSPKTFQRLQMSSAFTVEDKHIQVDDSIVPVDWKLNVLHLEQEIATMKSIHAFIRNVVVKHAANCDEKAAKNLAGIDAKMEKIKKLTDEAIMERITKGKECREYIYNKLHKLKDHYLPPFEVLDGYGWGISIVYPEDSIWSGGSNAWPGGKLAEGINVINSRIQSIIDASTEADILEKKMHI